MLVIEYVDNRNKGHWKTSTEKGQITKKFSPCENLPFLLFIVPRNIFVMKMDLSVGIDDFLEEMLFLKNSYS